MSILATILGSSDIIKSGLNLIDDMHTSKEEEIEAKSRAKIALLTSYAPFKVAQRYLALLFGFTFIGSFLLVLVLTLNGVGDIAAVKVLLDEFYIGEIMLTIVAFYFGGGAFEGIVKAKEK
ncbi:MAG: hypothetical protein ABGY11_05980 [Candidatus Thioglobus sp.]|jgi:hypothetical protein